MNASFQIVIECVVALALVSIGTSWCVRHIEAAEPILGVRSSTIALILPIFGPAGYAVFEAIPLHHSLRTISVGFSLASAAALLIAGGWAVHLGIKSINARIFQYFLMSIPIPLACVLVVADSILSRFEAVALILIYFTFVLSSWWIDRRDRARKPAAPLDQRARPSLAVLAAAWATSLAGSALLIECARTAIVAWHRYNLGGSLAGLGVVAQIATFAFQSTRQGRSEQAVAGVVGTLAFSSTVTLGIFGLMTSHSDINPSAYTIAAIATLLVPAVLFSLAFKQTKRVDYDTNIRDSDAHLDNVFAWRNLKRDLSNYQLLHHRNVDGNLVTGMNSGTHWVTLMLATAIAEQHRLEWPKYFSFDSASHIVGIPSKLVRRQGIPAIALSHNHPAALVAWPLVRRLLPFPKQVVLVRDIREVLISAYAKWMPDREVPFSEFVRGDPANRKGYLCDVWWYLSYLNRWGDVKASVPDETLIVRYEDLVENTGYWLRRISDHFGIDLSERAIEAGLTLRDKQAVLSKLDPDDTERVVADPEAKAAISFSLEDMEELRNILARHLRYDYGYDYGLRDVDLVPIDGEVHDAKKRRAPDPIAPVFRS